MDSQTAPSLFVLLAEDNKVNQNVQLRMLQKLGCQVQVADNGREAVEVSSGTEFNLIFMDCQMPEMDGVEATKLMRQQKNNQKTPIIALTGYGSADDKERFLAAGMNDLLVKPIKMDDFKAMLSKWTSFTEIHKKDSDYPSNIDQYPLFNQTKALERLGNDNHILQSVVETYIEDIPQQLYNLIDKINSGDIEGSRKINHSITGATTAVSGEKLLKHLELLRTHLLQKDLDNANREAKIIEIIFTQTLEKLKTYLKS
ncbi:response regulator [Spirochaeta cellobiosiphila]|uniref:response regulator n=1 Tax=Spirochaeta cellobiosiphila TaxID=504483 RepID=UPI00040718DC|nr:response regulator [Spirochaeta cellobiosiphila]